MNKHRANLDLMRAVAILLVVVFHISQYVEGIPQNWHRIFSFGAYGVDIFFVLSGWLIGGIFFREYKLSGRVVFSRFWSRRWLRTLPPYYVALFLSWYAVYITRSEQFDFGYLFFLQNYYSTIPFFKVSWSLCVEEHFYLLLPPLFYLSLKYNIVLVTCAVLILISLIARLYVSGDQYPGFGFLTNATHFRLDGLSLGVSSSYIHVFRDQWWPRYSFIIKVLGIVSCIPTVLFFYWHNATMYTVGLLGLSLAFCALLCVFVDSPDWKIAKSPIISIIALSSYSTYLTHALVINSMDRLFHYQGFVFALCSLLAVLTIGYGFRLLVEKPSLIIRDRVSP
jgi:peptidoglycan/LPS O-acetylase OafA/YrhL